MGSLWAERWWGCQVPGRGGVPIRMFCLHFAITRGDRRHFAEVGGEAATAALRELLING